MRDYPSDSGLYLTQPFFIFSSSAAAFRLPPIFSQVPLSTYFQSLGSLSTVDVPAQACLEYLPPQSFFPATAMP